MELNKLDVIGREKEAKNIFSILATQSIVLSSHRRMGKTFLLQKIEESHPDKIVPLFMIVEGKSSPEEFVHELYNRLIESGIITIDKSRKFKNWYERTLAGVEIKDMKLPSFRPHWKDALKKITEDIIEQQARNITVIMIDEFPIMLYKFIMEYKLIDEAVELIDTLREIRQLYGKMGIRFIFCGSIGINVVLEKLKQYHNYAGEPINDMWIETLDKMSIDDAKDLVKHLCTIKELKIEPNNNKTIESLCYSVDCLPFYIDLIIKVLEIKQQVVSPETINQEVENLIQSAGNQAQFNHYTDRISTYYEKDIGKISTKILNWLSTKEDFVEEGDIINYLSGKLTIRPEKVNVVLKKLFDDLYLNRKIEHGKRFYIFKYTLLKKWWMINFG